MDYMKELIEDSTSRVSALDVEIREFRAEGCIALTYRDMMVRYNVGKVKAQGYIRAIRSVCGGGKLCGARVLPNEVRYWESLIDMRTVRL